jgi:glycosyltransferase involved in cell wall biosynthesis
MKLLFVHETKIKEDKNGNLYSGGSYNQDVWNRYLSLANELTVISRREPIKYDENYAITNFNYLNKEVINFVEIEDLKSSIKEFTSIYKHKKNNETIKKMVMLNDYIIVRLPSASGYKAIKYAKKYNKPYLVEVVGCVWDSLWNHSLKGKFLAINSFIMMKRIIKNSPYVVYVTNEFLQRRYPSYGETIGCSDVKITNFDDRILEKRIKKIEEMKSNDPVILGTIAAVNVKYKGQKYVIKALAKLVKNGYNFEYHLVGNGDNSYLKSIAQKYGVLDKIRFIGSLPHDKIFEYLDSIDIYIQPSKQEGLPRALIEAMSRGCPSYGSTAGGIPELVNKELTFNKYRSNEIAKILKRNDKKLMIDEALRSFNKAKEYSSVLLDNRRNQFYMGFIKNGIK